MISIIQGHIQVFKVMCVNVKGIFIEIIVIIIIIIITIIIIIIIIIYNIIPIITKIYY